jgi:hypothetical protein
MLINHISEERKIALAPLLGGLQNVKEWQTFVNHLSEECIHEFKDHKGKPVEALKDITMDLAKGALKDDLMAAIKDSAEIPAEFKGATITDYIDLALIELFEIPAIVDAFKV